MTLDTKIAAIPANSAPKSDDYFALGVQKFEKQDYRGALAEYNRAIQINPNYAIAYNNRGILKYTKLNNRSGGISDMRQAARLFKSQKNTSGYNDAMGFLRQWGAAGTGGSEVKGSE